jgi:plasmid maintenance system antidote protein VapI
MMGFVPAHPGEILREGFLTPLNLSTICSCRSVMIPPRPFRLLRDHNWLEVA